MPTKPTIFLAIATTTLALGLGIVSNENSSVETVIEPVVEIIDTTCDEKEPAVVSLKSEFENGEVQTSTTTRDITSDEKADVKGCQIAKLSQDNVTKTIGKYVFAITSIDSIDGGVQVLARVFIEGKQVGFGNDGSVDIERFRIFNPPVLVPDGTKTLVQGCDTLSATSSSCIPTYIDNFKEDPQQALLLSLKSTMDARADLFDSSEIVKNKVGNTTSTFYSDAGSGGSVNVDGLSLSNDSGLGSWALAINDTTGGTPDVTTASQLFSRVRAVGGGTGYSCYRTFFVFNTSPLGNSTVNSATVSIFGNGTTNDFASSFGLYKGTLANTNNIVSGDFFGTKTNTTALSATTYSSASGWASAYNAFVLNATGISNISTTGKSVFSGRALDDIRGVASGAGNSQLTSFFADQTGTTNDPMLVVVSTGLPNPSLIVNGGAQVISGGMVIIK